MSFKKERRFSDAGSRIPVFIFPTSVDFYTQTREHRKQILTIYNPYEFAVHFRVLSTAPNCYSLTDSEGSVNSKNCVDLIIRLPSDVPLENSKTKSWEHKFRIHLYDTRNHALLGRRDISSVIHFSEYNGESQPELSNFGENFQQIPPEQGASNSKRYDSLAMSSRSVLEGRVTGGSSSQHPNLVAIVTALICIIGLMLPTYNEGSHHSSTQCHATSNNQASYYTPSYLHLSVNQKLLIAYTLGLVTIVIFRP